MLTIGKKAPAFTLLDQDERKTKLSDFAGQWVVLYFYPKDDTPGCTVEACEFSAALQDFAKLDAVVLGASPDPADKHQKFIAKYSLGLRLLCDPEHTTLEKYGAWGEKKLYGKVSLGVIRSTVIIDPEGKVAHRWAKVTTKGHAEKVRAKLEELRAAR